jgi:1,2-diacylglycerol 3-beta-glucosyltransferase
MAGVSIVLVALGALLLAAGAAMVATYWGLALVSLFRRARPTRDDALAQHSFAIVIPAHNEAENIGQTLRACQALDYPPDLCRIYVIADNCTDRTARVAREAGVECFERNDPARAGKGHALGFAFERIDLERHDAVLVLDADCVIDRHALRSIDRHLQDGERVLQMNYIVSNPDETPTSYLLAVGNLIENELYCAPKSDLGATILLRGTGMVLHRDVLRRFPWQAHSIVEDVEYGVTLARNGIRVRFIPEVAVRSAFPAGAAQLRVQRARWAGGTLGFARRQALRLMAEGVCRRRPALIDLGWTLITLSRPLVVIVATLALGLALAAALLAPGRGAPIPLALAACPLALLLAYVGLGIARLGVTRRRLGLLLGAPAVACQLLLIALRGLLRRSEGAWVRTPRSGAAEHNHHG